MKHPTKMIWLGWLMALGIGKADERPSTLKNPRVELQLVAEQAGIVPGRPFTVGLHIKHAPKYHTYWEYPGVVGIPTELRWTLPEGFKAGPIQWARPELTKMGLLTVYGYEGETTLLAEITPPADLTPGAEIALAARVVYMACAETCHPGFADLGLKLPVVAEAPTRNKQWHAAFEKTRASFAVPSQAWSFSGSGDMQNLQLVLAPGEKANHAISEYYFFDRDGQVDSDVDFVFKKDGKNLVIDMKRVDWAEAAPKRIRGILVAHQGSWEVGREVQAVSVDIEL